MFSQCYIGYWSRNNASNVVPKRSISSHHECNFRRQSFWQRFNNVPSSTGNMTHAYLARTVGYCMIYLRSVRISGKLHSYVSFHGKWLGFLFLYLTCALERVGVKKRVIWSNNTCSFILVLHNNNGDDENKIKVSVIHQSVLFDNAIMQRYRNHPFLNDECPVD